VDTSIIVAIIALVASVVSAAIAYYGQTHTLRIQARREARATLQRYREPLLDGAYELQSRFYNILCLRFLETYYEGDDAWQREYAVKHTLYVVGQYFAWTEILRRRIQFLDFGKVKETREVAQLLHEIRELFRSDKGHLGKPFMIWIGEQPAIGERMIVGVGDDMVSWVTEPSSSRTIPPSGSGSSGSSGMSTPLRKKSPTNAFGSFSTS
jgi:hypothetical protein